MRRLGRILLIEDDVNLRRTLTLMLIHAGYEVISATDRNPAPHSFELGDFDLFLMDVVQLDQVSRDILARFGRQDASTPVLIVIGQDQSDLDPELRQLGASAILHKPFDSESLLEQVTALLRPR